MQLSKGENYSKDWKFKSTKIPESEFILGTVKDGFGRNRRVVEAIDALNFYSNKSEGVASQYKPENITRELNKCLVGFQRNSDEYSDFKISTGKWGCGAFGGDTVFKCLIQIVVAAKVGRKIKIFMFNDKENMQILEKNLGLIDGVTVGHLCISLYEFDENLRLESDPQARLKISLNSYLSSIYGN